MQVMKSVFLQKKMCDEGKGMYVANDGAWQLGKLIRRHLQSLYVVL